MSERNFMVGKLCKINIKVKFVLLVIIMDLLLIVSFLIKLYFYGLVKIVNGKFCKILYCILLLYNDILNIILSNLNLILLLKVYY